MEHKTAGKTILYIAGTIILLLILAVVLGIMTGIIPVRAQKDTLQNDDPPSNTTIVDQQPSAVPSPTPDVPTQTPEMTLPEEETAYTIAVTCGKGGSVSPSGMSTVVQGGSMSITILPDEDHVVESVTLDGIDLGGNVGATVTLADIQADHSVYVSFAYSPVSDTTQPPDDEYPDVPEQSPEAGVPEPTASSMTYPSNQPMMLND